MFGTLLTGPAAPWTDTQRPADMRAATHASDTATVAPSYVHALVRQLQDVKSVHMNSEYGFTGSGTEDVSAACQAVMSAGKRAVFSTGTYLIGTSVVAPFVYLSGIGHRDDVVFRPASAAFTGYMFECTDNYNVKGVTFIGYNTFGSYVLGTAQTAYVGGHVSDVTIVRFDTGIRWAGDCLHPVGAFYENMYMQGFKHCGIQFGGVDKAIINGEDCLTVSGVVITNGNTPSDLIVPTVVPGNSSDALSWAAMTPAPAFGYIPVRSADGATGWHVPPLWEGGISKPWLMATSCSVEKTVGETWTYRIMRMTVGMFIAEVKNVSISTSHLGEQCNIGLLTYHCSGVDVTSGYYESILGSGQTYGHGPWAAVMTAGAGRTTVSSYWADGPQYAMISFGYSRMIVDMVAYNARAGSRGIGATHAQAGMEYRGELEFGTVAVQSINGSVGQTDYGVDTRNVQDQTRRQVICSPSSAVMGVAAQGVDRAYFLADSTGGTTITNQLRASISKKAQTPMLMNTNVYTFLTHATASPILTYTLPSDGASSLVLRVIVSVFFVGATRQVYSTDLRVTVISEGGGVILTDAVPLGTPTLLSANGTLTMTPGVTAVVGTVAGTVDVTVHMLATSSGASPVYSTQVLPMSLVGSNPTNMVIA